MPKGTLYISDVLHPHCPHSHPNIQKMFLKAHNKLNNHHHITIPCHATKSPASPVFGGLYKNKIMWKEEKNKTNNLIGRIINALINLDS